MAAIKRTIERLTRISWDDFGYDHMSSTPREMPADSEVKNSDYQDVAGSSPA